MVSHLKERLKQVKERLKLAEERLDRIKSSGCDCYYDLKNITVKFAFNWSEDMLGDRSIDEPAGG